MMGCWTRLLLAGAVAVTFVPAQAALFRRAGTQQGGSGNIALRRRLHVNTLITEPGSFEVEWNHAFDTTGAYAMPSTIKYTPEGHHILWGRTEFAIGFDSLSSAVQFDDRITQFSDHLSLSATAVIHDGEKLDIAVAPVLSFYLRNEDGVRTGATAIARYDSGRNSAGVTFTWTGATASSVNNPAGTFDAGAGFGRRLAASGKLGHLTPHTNVLWEKSTGATRQFALFEGIEYQITEKVALDFSGQHFGLGAGPVDHQIVIGLTVRIGK